MRITRTRYERAKIAVAKARKHLALIEQWDKAIKHFGQPNAVDAMTIQDDGSIRFELMQRAKTADSHVEVSK